MGRLNKYHTEGEGRHLLLHTVTDLRSCMAAIRAMQGSGIKFSYIVLPANIYTTIQNEYVTHPLQTHPGDLGVSLLWTDRIDRMFIYKRERG